MLELCVSRSRVGGADLGNVEGRLAAPPQIEGHARRDRERPGPQLTPVHELRVAAQRAEEGLLKGILGGLPSEQADEVAEDLVPVLFIEALERRDCAHGRIHHPLKRAGTSSCEAVRETSAVRFAVVGHVEWVEFARVERVPEPGEIVHTRELWAEPAGGGAVAAVQLARLAGACTLFTALGDDELGRRARDELRRLGVRVEAVFRGEFQRRAFTFVDDAGERTITVIGERLGPAGADPLPWDELAVADGVYFVSGDADAVRAARWARVLVATARSLPALRKAGVQVDALVRSGSDASERYEPGDLDPAPRLEVATAGQLGGTYTRAGGSPERYPPSPLPGRLEDTYGAGDSFAAGLTFALAERRPVEEALAFASRRGAAALARRGAHGV
jgi:ribokinase